MGLRGFLLFVNLLSVAALPPELKTSCGRRPLLSSSGMLPIMGGDEAPVGAWPWQVSVGVRTNHFCGGTILSPLWVITAAHCLAKYSSPSYWHLFTVMAGLHSQSKPGPHTQTRQIRSITIHQGYYSVTMDNDVSPLHLMSPLYFNDHVQPLCLPPSMTDEFSLNYRSCFITGWGSNIYNGKYADRLQEAEVFLINMATCIRLTENYTDNKLCAGHYTGRVDSCEGDSGGPLQCYRDEDRRFYLVGMTSYGHRCGYRRRFGWYARTSRFVDWIQNVTTPRVSTHTVAKNTHRRSSPSLTLLFILLPLIATYLF